MYFADHAPPHFHAEYAEHEVRIAINSLAVITGSLPPRAMGNGTLILDVREWAASVKRKAREPLFRKRVSTERGELTFTSVTALEHENRQLLISERHELVTRGEERVSEYNFVMRCWERDELNILLARPHFGELSCFGAYDPDVAAGATDRLVAVAQCVDAAA